MLQDLIEQLQFAQKAIKENGQLEVEVKSMEQEIDELKDENRVLEEKLQSAYNAINELEENPSFESTFLGLDTLKWTLDSGNLAITQRIESFLDGLQKNFPHHQYHSNE